MTWRFVSLPPNLVEVEVTQRDQFRNDDVELSAALVRETIQNSMDASAGSDPVRVTFSFVSVNTGLDSQYLKGLFEGHQRHFEESNCFSGPVDFENARALVIEDFKTYGLTGNTTAKDNGNFSDFWRRHGQSHKSGRSGGRWGLGKLVYSSSSELSSFFGLTYRLGDNAPKLMGQTVLSNHTVDDTRYAAHGFYADLGPDSVSIPIENAEVIQRFVQQFKVGRETEPGLSIVIPLPHQEISEEKMIRATIDNYFYPIITGQLIVKIGDTHINASNIRNLAPKHSDDKRLTMALFEFIEEIHNHKDEELMALKPTWFENAQLDDGDFEEADLERIRKDFSAGKLIALSLPITIKPKSGSPQQTRFKVYLKRPDLITAGRDLYVRGCLTVPGEAKFGARKAFGAMVADDEPIAAFLADAENPSHTKWTQNTEKLNRNYKSYQKRVKAIQHSVRQLYDMLAQSIEEEDTESLKKFFWNEVEDAIRPKKRGTKSPAPPPDLVPPQPRPLRVKSEPGGFSVLPTKDLTIDMLPLVFKIDVAYNVPRGNPFSAHKPWDFDFTGKVGASPKIRATPDVVSYSKEHTAPSSVGFKVTDPSFAISVSGFDENRDIVVKLKTVEVEP